MLTTLITPFGRYAFCRLPFGISSTPEMFQRKMSAVIMDDILTHGRNIEEHDARLDAVIRIIYDSGLNPTQENGRQFVLDEFRKFAKSWCFIQQTTNPYSPQDNGMAERAVQTAKRLLDLDVPEIDLLNHHASSHSAISVSCAVALMSRQLATRLPIVTMSPPRCGHPQF